MIMRRFYLVAVTIFLMLSVTAVPAWAGEKIALLISLDDGPFKEMVGAFTEYLGKQGAQPSYELFSLEGNPSKAGAAIQKIKVSGFTLIYTLGSLATEAAVKEISDIPIVAGLIMRTDAFRKTPNATGVGLEFPIETQFTWMQKMLPQARTIGVLYSAQENKKRVESAARAAQKLGFKLEPQEVSSAQDIPDALQRLSKKAEVVWGLTDTVVLSPQSSKPILLFSLNNNIPFIGPSSMWVKAGALYALDYDYRDLGVQCAEMALKVMRGAPIAEVPPAAPRSVKYSLNTITARQMKIALDESVVKGALHVY